MWYVVLYATYIHLCYVANITTTLIKALAYYKRDSNGQFTFPMMLTPSVLSDLQKRILIHVCTTVDASYGTMTRDLKRDRITVLQSLTTLIEYNYIYKNKVNPELDKSKLIFLPTHKAIAFAWRYLQVSTSDVIRVKKDEITNYLKVVLASTRDLRLRDQRIGQLFSKLERGILEFNDDTDSRKALVVECIYEEIISCNNRGDYDSKYTSGVKELLLSEEIQELVKILTSTRSNIDLAIRELSKFK